MNKDFVIYNAAGEILRTGSCPEEDLALQVFDGELMLEGTASCERDSVDPVSKQVIPNGRAVPVTPVLPTAPQSSTLPVDQQLDLLWQAMDAGTFPKAEPFYSAIKASKG